MDDRDERYPLLLIWRRFRRLFQRDQRQTYELDLPLAQALKDLAVRDRRPPAELAADLLADALARREQADRCLAHWRELSLREREVAALTCLNCTNRQIAARLHIAPDTVKTHVRNVLLKFGVSSKAALRQQLADWDFTAWEKPNR
jgi:DNA-binding CsgD family transcriptional regulator